MPLTLSVSFLTTLQQRLPSGLFTLLLICLYGPTEVQLHFMHLEVVVAQTLATTLPIVETEAVSVSPRSPSAHQRTTAAKPSGWSQALTRWRSAGLGTLPKSALGWRVRPRSVLQSCGVALMPLALYGTGVNLSIAHQHWTLGQLSTQVNGLYAQSVEQVNALEIQRTQSLQRLEGTNQSLLEQRTAELAQFAEQKAEVKAQLKVEAQIERLLNTGECRGCVFPPGTDLSGLSLVGVNLQGAVLDGCLLVGTALQGANLASASLQGADLSETRLTYSSFKNANLAGALLTNANGGSVEWSGANLRGADLTNGFFQSSLFRGADLREANLRGADVSYSNFMMANLTGVDTGGLTASRHITKPNGESGHSFRSAAGRR